MGAPSTGVCEGSLLFCEPSPCGPSAKAAIIIYIYIYIYYYSYYYYYYYLYYGDYSYRRAAPDLVP